MGLYRDQGIVLRTWKLGETDRILNILAQDRGKIRAVAKAVRRPGSRFGGRLEPFSHVDLQLYEGRNLDIVTDAQLIAPYAAVRADYALSTAAATMAEATDRVAQEGERNLPVLLLLRAGLKALEAGPPEPGIFVDAFLLRLAEAAGFRAAIDGCAGCGRSGTHRFLDVGLGGTVCGSCAPAGARPSPSGAVELIRLLAGGSWADLPRATSSPGARRAASAFARGHVEHHFDRRLRSYPLVPR